MAGSYLAQPIRGRRSWQAGASCTRLPRFVDYLVRSVEGAAVIDVHSLAVLVLALPDWNEDDLALAPGFCWMGTPAADSQIDQLVGRVGQVPASLEQLWRVASFINIKEHSMLCSPDPAARPMAEEPVILPALADPHAPQDTYECLQIAVVNTDMVTCLTRPPGQPHWNDFLVRRFRRTGELASAVRTRLDDKLADWTFTEWTP